MILLPRNFGILWIPLLMRSQDLLWSLFSQLQEAGERVKRPPSNWPHAVLITRIEAMQFILKDQTDLLNIGFLVVHVCLWLRIIAKSLPPPIEAYV
jgi:hypothetical protein